MKTIWKEVPRDHVKGQWSALHVSMSRRGEIAMTRVTHERMDSPKAFHLLFDAVNNRIGLKPAAITARNAYPAGPSGRCGGRVVRAFRLMQECGVRIPETLQFTDTEIDDDRILVLDLRTAIVSTRAVATRTRTATNRPSRRDFSSPPLERTVYRK